MKFNLKNFIVSAAVIFLFTEVDAPIWLLFLMVPALVVIFPIWSQKYEE